MIFQFETKFSINFLFCFFWKPLIFVLKTLPTLYFLLLKKKPLEEFSVYNFLLCCFFLFSILILSEVEYDLPPDEVCEVQPVADMTEEEILKLFPMYPNAGKSYSLAFGGKFRNFLNVDVSFPFFIFKNCSTLPLEVCTCTFLEFSNVHDFFFQKSKMF